MRLVIEEANRRVDHVGRCKPVKQDCGECNANVTRETVRQSVNDVTKTDGSRDRKPRRDSGGGVHTTDQDGHPPVDRVRERTSARGAAHIGEQGEIENTVSPGGQLLLPVPEKVGVVGRRHHVSITENRRRTDKPRRNDREECADQRETRLQIVRSENRDKFGTGYGWRRSGRRCRIAVCGVIGRSDPDASIAARIASGCRRRYLSSTAVARSRETSSPNRPESSSVSANVHASPSASRSRSATSASSVSGYSARNSRAAAVVSSGEGIGVQLWAPPISIFVRRDRPQSDANSGDHSEFAEGNGRITWPFSSDDTPTGYAPATAPTRSEYAPVGRCPRSCGDYSVLFDRAGPGTQTFQTGPLGLFPYADWLHFLAYACLAAMLAYALYDSHLPAWQVFVLVFCCAAGYGVTIELLQSRLPSRTFAFGDIGVNAGGAAVAVVCWRVLVRYVQFYQAARPADLELPRD